MNLFRDYMHERLPKKQSFRHGKNSALYMYISHLRLKLFVLTVWAKEHYFTQDLFMARTFA